MRHLQRKTNPKVVSGTVQKKNNDHPTHNYYDDREPELVIDRRRPGPGARHLLKVEDIKKFVSIIPGWDELGSGIDAIALLPFSEDQFGSYNLQGVIKIRAWPTNLWVEMSDDLDHRKGWLIQTLGVETEGLSYGGYLAKFTENQAKAFQLLGTFLHELGHHVDRMNCRRKHDCPGGEPFAIQFEQDMQKVVWPKFSTSFPLP